MTTEGETFLGDPGLDEEPATVSLNRDFACTFEFRSRAAKGNTDALLEEESFETRPREKSRNKSG